MIKSKLKQLALLAGDWLIMLAGLYLALLIRYLGLPTAEIWETNIRVFQVIFIIWLAIFYLNDLYDLRIFSQKNKFLESFLSSLTISFILAILYLYLFPNLNGAPKTNLLIFTVTGGGLILAWRYTFLSFLKHRLPKTNLGIIGYNPLMHEVVEELSRNPQLGYDIKFIILENPNLEVALESKHVPIFTSEDNLEELISKYKINNLVLEKSLNESVDLQKKLLKLRELL